MLKTLFAFAKTVAVNVASKAAAAAGPAAKQAFIAMDPKVEFKCYSKDSRFHANFDASLNLPGELDSMAADAVNSSGLLGLGNSPETSFEPGTQPAP